MLSDAALTQRIRKRLTALGRGAVDAALRGGLERNYIRDLINGKKKSVKPSNYDKIARGLDWSVQELIDEDFSRPSRNAILPSAVSIPEIDLRAGAGYAGGIAQEDDAESESVAVRARWGIPGPFLREELRLDPNRVHILAIRGDSMMDALYDGDRALIDLGDTDVSQGGIFALQDDIGSVIIKQVELVRGQGGRRILCKSRNPQYEPFELTLDEPVRIIGRVAGKITRL